MSNLQKEISTLEQHLENFYCDPDGQDIYFTFDVLEEPSFNALKFLEKQKVFDESSHSVDLHRTVKFSRALSEVMRITMEQISTSVDKNIDIYLEISSSFQKTKEMLEQSDCLIDDFHKNIGDCKGTISTDYETVLNLQHEISNIDNEAEHLQRLRDLVSYEEQLQELERKAKENAMTVYDLFLGFSLLDEAAELKQQLSGVAAKIGHLFTEQEVLGVLDRETREKLSGLFLEVANTKFEGLIRQRIKNTEFFFKNKAKCLKELTGFRRVYVVARKEEDFFKILDKTFVKGELVNVTSMINANLALAAQDPKTKVAVFKKILGIHCQKIWKDNEALMSAMQMDQVQRLSLVLDGFCEYINLPNLHTLLFSLAHPDIALQNIQALSEHVSSIFKSFDGETVAKFKRKSKNFGALCQKLNLTTFFQVKLREMLRKVENVIHVIESELETPRETGEELLTSIKGRLKSDLDECFMRIYEELMVPTNFVFELEPKFIKLCFHFISRVSLFFGKELRVSEACLKSEEEQMEVFLYFARSLVAFGEKMRVFSSHQAVGLHEKRINGCIETLMRRLGDSIAKKTAEKQFHVK